MDWWVLFCLPVIWRMKRNAENVHSFYRYYRIPLKSITEMLHSVLGVTVINECAPPCTQILIGLQSNSNLWCKMAKLSLPCCSHKIGEYSLLLLLSKKTKKKKGKMSLCTFQLSCTAWGTTLRACFLPLKMWTIESSTSSTWMVLVDLVCSSKVQESSYGI